MAKPPKDPTSLVGLLQCVDGTAAVWGMPHAIVEKGMPMSQPLRPRSTVRLTREAGEALKELLDEWLSE